MHLTRLALIAAIAGLTIAAAPETADIADLSWLSGDWISETGARWTEESWMPPRAGIMLGTGRSGKAGKLQVWELLRIEAGHDGVLTYWGAPMGGKPTPFKLTQRSATEVVFENPAHDFPTRIAYRRVGTSLIATVSGANGSNAETWTYRRRP